ncbi:MAG TPA: hypothetical protein V6C86_21570 [Oculatellaceae cyanobacterium]
MSPSNLKTHWIASLVALLLAGASAKAAPLNSSANKSQAKASDAAAGRPSNVANSSTAVGSPKSKGWLLEQTDRVDGDRTVYLSPKGIRIVNKQSRTAIVACPPQWRVSTISDSKKVYFECTLDKFDNPLSKPIAVVYGVNLALIPMKKKSVATRFGVSANIYESPTRLKSKEFWNTPLDEKGAHRLPSSGLGEFTDDFHLPEPETLILLRTYGLPKEPGIPLSFQYSDQDNDVHKFMHTYSLQPTEVADDLFKVPAGYKKVAHPEQVTRTSENDGVEALF